MGLVVVANPDDQIKQIRVGLTEGFVKGRSIRYCNNRGIETGLSIAALCVNQLLSQFRRTFRPQFDLDGNGWWGLTTVPDVDMFGRQSIKSAGCFFPDASYTYHKLHQTFSTMPHYSDQTR